MNKSIIVIDTPANCMSCMFLEDDYVFPTCILTNETNGEQIQSYETIMKKCPLKKLPQKDTMRYTVDSCNIYNNGWNDCIDRILEK